MLLADRIAHIPLRQRRALQGAVEILFQEFEEAQKGKLSGKAKRGRILKLILYGSFARGGWQDDRVSGFVSDFDLLAIVNHEPFAQGYEAWEWAEDRFVQHAHLREHQRPHPSVIVHSYQDVNDQLARGRPFFADIVREGIVLYEAEGFPLSEIGPFTEAVRREEAWLHFDTWFPGACRALITAREQAAKATDDPGWRKSAAFSLHQATEGLYHCFMLVLTLYSPKLHALRKLRSLAEGKDIRLVAAWPRDTRFSRRCFSLLHDAYVKARYSYHYAITAEDLAWLTGWVEILSQLVAEICAERPGERPEATEGAAR